MKFAPPPDAKRPSGVSPCQRPVIQCPTPDVGSCLMNVAATKSLIKLAREFARVQGQNAGRDEDDGSNDVSGPPPVSKSVRVVRGRRHHPLRILLDHSMCRDGVLKICLPKRRAASDLAGRRFNQTVLGTFLMCERTCSLWSKTSKSTIPWSRTQEIESIRASSIPCPLLLSHPEFSSLVASG